MRKVISLPKETFSREIIWFISRLIDPKGEKFDKIFEDPFEETEAPSDRGDISTQTSS